MKTKVYLAILCSILLVMVVNNVGSVVGNQMRAKATETMYAAALGERSISELSAEEMQELMQSVEFSARLRAENEAITAQFRWYFVANFAVQTLLVLLIVLGCSWLVVGIVRRNIQSQ